MDSRFQNGPGWPVKSVVFYLGLGALLTHELDAMANHEWLVLPLLRTLPDETGMTLFVALHVPLFAILIALIASPRQRPRSLARLAVAGFLLVHGILHLLFMDHPAYEFASILSDSLIFGGAFCGAVYLALTAMDRRGRPASTGGKPRLY